VILKCSNFASELSLTVTLWGCSLMVVGGVGILFFSFFFKFEIYFVSYMAFFVHVYVGV